MEQIKLFKIRKIITIIVGLVGLIILPFYILDLFLKFDLNSYFLFIGFLLFPQMIIGYWSFNKYFIRFDNQFIEWYFPGMKERKGEILTGTTSELKTNRRRVTMTNGNKKIEILTDGLWDRDKDLICKKLKEYYQ